MTPAHIAQVRCSFALIEPIATEAAALFYDHLFRADPGLRRLFQGNLAQQEARFINMIGAAVDLLDETETLTPELRKLGARHANYGVREEHYDTAGTALLKTLRQALGEAYTDEVHAAWVLMYRMLSTTMIDAARGRSVQAA